MNTDIVQLLQQDAKEVLQQCHLVRQKQFEIFAKDKAWLVLTTNLVDCAFIVLQSATHYFIAHKDFLNDLTAMELFVEQANRDVELVFLAGMYLYRSTTHYLVQNDLDLKRQSKKNYDEIQEIFNKYDIPMPEEKITISDKFSLTDNREILLELNPGQKCIVHPVGAHKLHSHIDAATENKLERIQASHPQELLALAGTTMLPLRRKSQPYILEAYIQQRIRVLVTSYYYYRQWRSKSCLLIGTETESSRFFSQHQNHLAPVVKTFCRDSGRGATVLCDTAIKRFLWLVECYRETLINLFERSEVAYTIDTHGIPMANSNKINQDVLDMSIDINPETRCNSLVVRQPSYMSHKLSASL